jgi:uncharacterized repeat protein (TIGR01451 family)
MRSAFWLPVGIAIAATAAANEVTIQNDSLTDGSSGTIQAGFVAGEKAASWLTTPCEGNIVAVQVFWRSLSGGAPVTIEDSIDIYRSGSFPVPGVLAQEIGGPVLTDGVLNEYRYLDENNTIPLIVPVVQDETFIVALTFDAPPDPLQGPSVVDDADGIEPNRNAIYASVGGGNFTWFSNSSLGVNGDWVIRAVVDCQAGSTEADVGVTMSADPPQYVAAEALTYTITVDNAGPGAAASTTVVDAFPPAYTGVAWTCVPSGGASCTASGTGTIAQSVSLPAGSQVVYTVDGVVADGTAGTLTNSATAVVGAPATDPDPSNNTATLDVDPAPPSDVIFADGFDPAG